MSLLIITIFYVIPSLIALRIIYGLTINIIFCRRPPETRPFLSPWLGGMVLGLGIFCIFKLFTLFDFGKGLVGWYPVRVMVEAEVEGKSVNLSRDVWCTKDEICTGSGCDGFMSTRWQQDASAIVQHKIGEKRWVVIDPVGRVCHSKYYEKQSYYRPPAIVLTDDIDDPSFIEVSAFKKKDKNFNYKDILIKKINLRRIKWNEYRDKGFINNIYNYSFYHWSAFWKNLSEESVQFIRLATFTRPAGTTGYVGADIFWGSFEYQGNDTWVWQPKFEKKAIGYKIRIKGDRKNWVRKQNIVFGKKSYKYEEGKTLSLPNG